LNNELPNSIESEKAILGGILIEPLLLDAVKRELSAARFYLPSHQKIFTAMLSLREQDVDLSPILIAEAIKQSGDTETSIGYITDLATVHPRSTNLSHYVKQVLRTARKRWIMQFGERLIAKAAEGDDTEDELLAYAASQIDSARTRLPHQAKVRFTGEMIDDQAERYRRWHKGISDALPTAFDVIDNHLLGGGFVPSGLYILAARPSMGKTALCLDIAANIAQEGKIVHLVSREMPAESLFDRLHAANAGIARWKLRPGIYATEYHKLIETLPKICELPIALDNLSLTTADIRANFRELERKHKRPDLLIVDYIQLVEGAGRSRNDEVGSVTRALKGIAMEFHVPVLALSQLSRDCEKQKREPELSDLRDSGEIEQDADAVFFLFGERPEESAKIFSRWFKCAKQRDGELFRAEMTFNGELVTFRSFEMLALAGAQQMGDVA
jgi:replicative DNA helicase